MSLRDSEADKEAKRARVLASQRRRCPYPSLTRYQVQEDPKRSPSSSHSRPRSVSSKIKSDGISTNRDQAMNSAYSTEARTSIKTSKPSRTAE